MRGGDHVKQSLKLRKSITDNNSKMPGNHINAYSKACDDFDKKNGITPRPKAQANTRAKGGNRGKITALLEQLGQRADSAFSSSDNEASCEYCGALRTFRVNAENRTAMRISKTVTSKRLC